MCIRLERIMGLVGSENPPNRSRPGQGRAGNSIRRTMRTQLQNIIRFLHGRGFACWVPFGVSIICCQKLMNFMVNKQVRVQDSLPFAIWMWMRMDDDSSHCHEMLGCCVAEQDISSAAATVLSEHSDVPFNECTGELHWMACAFLFLFLYVANNAII